MSVEKFRKDPKIKLLADRFEKAVAITMEKVAGHLLYPQQYPLSASAESLERALYDLLLSVPKRKRDKFIDKHKTSLNATAAQRQQRYGDLAAIDIHMHQPISEQVKKIVVPDNRKIAEADLERFNSYFTKPRRAAGNKKAVGPKAKQPAVAATPGSKLVFTLLDLTCDKTSEIRKDEISLAGFAIDSLGVRQDKPAFFIGDFKKGDSISIDSTTGQLFGFDINPASPDVIFPVSTSVGLFLVEKDLISNQDLANKWSTVFLAISFLLDAVTLAMVGVAMAGGPFSLAAWLILTGGAMLFGQIALTIIPMMTDDVSSAAEDVLLLEAPPNIGEQFNRSLSFELYNLNQGLMEGKPGKYRANIRWDIF